MKKLLNFEDELNNTLEHQKDNFVSDINKSLKLETGLLDAIKRAGALNLRAFLRDNQSKVSCLYGIPIVTLISPDFVFERDCMSAIAVSLGLPEDLDFKLVFANLTNIAAYKRVQASAVLGVKTNIDKYKIHDSCFIETQYFVIFPAFNFLIKKEDFYKMTDPVVYDEISKEELNKSLIYTRIKETKHIQNTCDPVWDYPIVSYKIETLLIGQVSKEGGIMVFSNSNTRVQEIDRILYYKLLSEKKVMAQINYNLMNNNGFTNNPPSSLPETDDDFQAIYKLIV